MTANTAESDESMASGSWRQKITEPYVLFPSLAVLLLGILWGTTWNLIRVERSAAEMAAASSAGELAETYEAQVVRALREIDQTLKVVKYAYEKGEEQQALTNLAARQLLLPDFLFVVSMTDKAGYVRASTGATDAAEMSVANVANEDYFRFQLDEDGFAIGRPRQDESSGEWQLVFSRGLADPDGEFAGIVMVSVGVDYFVSGYDIAKLGQQGLLGLLGTDGIFRVMRTGETVASGEVVDYSTLVRELDEDSDETPSFVMVNGWDGVKRFTSARKLYEFPVAVVLGLSFDEQMQPVAVQHRIYVIRAAAASVSLIILMTLLARLSMQLQRSRQRAMEEQITHAEQVEHLAYHDGLTGLPNRSFFSKLLSQGIAEAGRYNRKLALLFLDLDRFKLINDTLGHDVGDDLLKEVAVRLREALRETDIVARLGGDEFVVILPETNEEKYLSEVGKKILQSVGKAYELAGQNFRITVSIGISVFPVDGQDEQTLMKSADIAMYHAKDTGKNNFRFYSEELNKESLERMALESSLRVALERNELLLHYQEKRDLQSNQVTGVEALLRWQHPELGLVAPRQFLPLAEETGLIVPIGKWVIETACKQCMAWQAKGVPPRKMAINLTARQFGDAHLIDDLAGALRVSGMDPGLLELEITEIVFMSNIDKAVEILTRVKAMGVRVAIDNFGTSYTSLSTLKQFQFDAVKIDGSIIRDSVTNEEDRALTEAIISMGKRLALTVVAEGVETLEQATFLRDSHCDEVQGFYYDKPAPAESKSTGLSPGSPAEG